MHNDENVERLNDEEPSKQIRSCLASDTYFLSHELHSVKGSICFSFNHVVKDGASAVDPISVEVA